MRTQRAASAGRPRVVPLEAGAGPDNPPCPACGEPLFGWLEARPGLAGPLRRCESCGLGVIGEPGGIEAALAELDGLDDGDGPRIPNRAGFSAALGGAGWAGLQPGARHLFTPEAVRRLVANRDQVVARASWSPLASIAAMWQTLLNSATFGHNVLVGSPLPASKGWQRRIDWLTTIVLAIPALLVAVPLELLAATAGRGSAIAIRVELL